MLTGPKLNPVQFQANVLLDKIAVLESDWQRDRALRLALVASGRIADPADIFEEFAEIVDDDAAEIDEGTDQEGNPVSTKWDYSKATTDKTPEEIEEEIRQMLALAAEGSASFDEMDYGDWV